MTMELKRRVWVAVSILMIFPSFAYSANEIRFAATDLGALIELSKPNQTTLKLDGRRGEFVPGPSLLYVGLHPIAFDIDLSVGELVDMRFNQVKGKSITLALEDGRARLSIAIEDREKAIKSALGSIDFKNLVLTAGFKFAPDGSNRLILENSTISGELRGRGLLKPKWVIDSLRKTALKVLRSQVEKQISQPTFQEAFAQGMIIWAKFSSDERLTKVVPGSSVISQAGLIYQAE
jgi:hypothetical protein